MSPWRIQWDYRYKNLSPGWALQIVCILVISWSGMWYSRCYRMSNFIFHHRLYAGWHTFSCDYAAQRSPYQQESGDFMVLPDAGSGRVHNTWLLMVRLQSFQSLSMPIHSAFILILAPPVLNCIAIILINIHQILLLPGKVDSVESGGVGGNIKSKVYILPKIQLTIGEKMPELKDIAVRTTPAFKGQKYNGNIGQDVIKQFNEMILNFESMYLLFK